MALSRELQIGKAGEHFVCTDLIIQGFNAFLADQGLPYDVVVDVKGHLLRVQVRTTQQLKDYPKALNVYRYGMRRARGSRIRYNADQIDYFAFVALDIMKVAYLPVEDLISKTGGIKTTVEFRTRRKEYTRWAYKSGVTKASTQGKYIEDYAEFNSQKDYNIKLWEE